MPDQGIAEIAQKLDQGITGTLNKLNDGIADTLKKLAERQKAAGQAGDDARRNELDALVKQTAAEAARLQAEIARVHGEADAQGRFGHDYPLPLGGGVEMQMIWVKPGNFMMGSAPEERTWAAGPEGQAMPAQPPPESPDDIRIRELTALLQQTTTEITRLQAEIARLRAELDAWARIGRDYSLPLGGGVEMQMIWVKPGSFLMGSVPEERAWAAGSEGQAQPEVELPPPPPAPPVPRSVAEEAFLLAEKDGFAKDSVTYWLEAEKNIAAAQLNLNK